MAEFKIENKKLSIEINGEKYAVNKPKFKQMIEMQEKIESLSSLEKFKYTKQVIIEAGIPELVIDDLDADSVIELLSIINGTKKN